MNGLYGLDQNMVVIAFLAILGLIIYYILKFTRRGKKTTRTFQKKERKWLKQEKKFIMKLLKWVLVPATLIWIFFDVFFVALANYYFQNVIFGPLLGFTPLQTLIATILLLFLGYLIYKTYFHKRGANN